MKEKQLDKRHKIMVPLAGVALSLITMIVYIIAYGGSNRSMDSMSWQSAGFLVVGIVISGLIFLIKQAVWVPIIMSIFHFLAFLYYIYGMYPYISAAIVGIDSTWETVFFITTLLFVIGLVVNVIGVFQSLKVKRKLVKASVPVTAFLLGIMILGSTIANENAAQISGFLNTPSFQIIQQGNASGDSEYYKSRFDNLESLISAGRALGETAMAEGAVLLKNENQALPLSAGENAISLFGIGCVDPAYGGTGSGLVDVSTAPTYKDALERNENFRVNDVLWNWYSDPAQEQYKRGIGDTGPGVKGAKSIGEAPWQEVNAANQDSFVQFGDAAIVVFARLGGEGSDMPRGDRSLSRLDDYTGTMGDTTNGDYLKLSPKEQDLLKGIKQKKDEGVFNKVVVLINAANQIEAEFINDPSYGIDAALWIGTPGQTGLYAVSDILSGKINPSGKLSTTFWRTHDKNPSLANFGVSMYDGAPNAVNTDGSPQQDKYYVVYQEGIYLGYKYTESRYEDYVMNTPNAGSYLYGETVSYPFGYGRSYSDFAYSNFHIKKTGTGADTQYTVNVTVTNNGPMAGKEAVQIYLQKAYGDYNKSNEVEAASVELVGFAKTKSLNVGESETLTVPVDERQFASYDANNANTYVITDGDYYLTAAPDAHSAVNNILAKKGYTIENTANKMDAGGESSLVSEPLSYQLDTETYSTSAATGAKITNQFEYADLNKYENKGSDSVQYTTRTNWDGTTPKNWDGGVVLHWNEHIDADQSSLGRQGETALPETDAEYPIFDTYQKDADGKSVIMALIDLRVDADGNKIPYEDERWNTLLDQLSWEDYANLIPTGMRRTGQIDSINKPETLDHNGPSGLTQPYSANARGLATETNDPLKDSRAMCYPSGGVLAASFNVDLMYNIGDLVGEDALWAGYNGLYGPGSNIQRTPYSGRNFEYFSEDGFLSGLICAYETAAMESHGLFVYNKHIGLNDQEDLRRGICTWANEQSIREIYMRAFELPITISGAEYNYNGQTVTLKGASGVMLAFNRMGLHWAGMQKGLCTNFLRNECGMTGIIVSDMWYGTASPYMNLPAMLVAGGNLVDGMMDAKHLDASRPGNNHADVAWAMREAMHRILYTVVHSNTMNGIAEGTEMVRITPWWQTALVCSNVVLGIAFLAALAWTILHYRKEKNCAA